jgi:predicted phosphodiesterase
VRHVSHLSSAPPGRHTWGVARSSARLAVVTDAHANLPALRAALAAIRAEGCDGVVHTGDAVGIGPFPAECLEALLARPALRLVLGNHDAWLAHGPPAPRPDWMSAGEAAHHRWVRARVPPALRAAVGRWPRLLAEDVAGARVVFLHYALGAPPAGFAPVVPDPQPADLDRLFAAWPADVVCYGHHHPASDLRGAARYVNPGSLGCHDRPLARYALLDVGPRGAVRVTRRAVPYDDAPLFRALEARRVPERALLRRVFFPRPGP